jgi:exonuclease VII small subunit
MNTGSRDEMRMLANIERMTRSLEKIANSLESLDYQISRQELGRITERMEQAILQLPEESD